MDDKELAYLKKYLEPSKLEEGITRFQNGEPLQYIVGNVDFYGYTFKVNKDVLIPRFETELLVNKTINYINNYLNNDISILDLGTGSGCIAITLQKELPQANVTAVDICDKALEVAKDNALSNNVDITFIRSDMLTNINSKYDVIISNPPYMGYEDEVMELVSHNEPHLALYADNEGLKHYEDILRDADKYLNDKFIMAFEIGKSQGLKISDMAYKYFPNATIKLEKDMLENDRYIFIINI